MYLQMNQLLTVGHTHTDWNKWVPFQQILHLDFLFHHIFCCCSDWSFIAALRWGNNQINLKLMPHRCMFIFLFTLWSESCSPVWETTIIPSICSLIFWNSGCSNLDGVCWNPSSVFSFPHSDRVALVYHKVHPKWALWGSIWRSILLFELIVWSIYRSN